MNKQLGNVSNKLNMSIILGGYLSEKRATEAKLGEKPRIDCLELASRLNVPLFDLHWLEKQIRKHSLLDRAMKIYKNKSNWLALKVFLTLDDTDVVFSAGEDTGIPLAILLRLTRKKRPRIIMRLEQPTYGRTPWRSRIYRAYYRLAMPRIDLTLCRTHSHIKLLKSWGAREEQIVFIPETIDPIFFDLERNAPRHDSFQLPPQPFILSAGLEMRDYDTLIKAVEGLPYHVIIAAGSPWSKFSFDRSESTIPKNIIVSTFTQLQMRELYRFAECIVVPVMPTMRACGMNVVLEAWAMQKPVIASRTDGLTSYIEDGQTGLFYEPLNVEDLRAKIQYTLGNPEEARDWGKNGWQRIQTEFNLDCYLNEIVNAAKVLTSVP